jgi:hypothetical protein
MHTSRTSNGRPALLVVILAVSAGCSPQPAETSVDGRYRVTASSATLRTPGATLTTRALIGADGKTEVTLTTGSLDSSEPGPGEITHVLFKGYDARDKLRFLRVVKGNGTGTLTFVESGLSRGQPYHVLALVRTPGTRGIDVLTVSDVVRVGPNLAVSQLSAPASAAPGAPVNVSALVSETNGDVGTFADCVLSVDGVEADRATGIWIDAGDTVSCAFTARIDSPGMHGLSVAVANVTPADAPLDDNSGSATIEVVKPVVFRFSASVSSFEYRSTSREDGRYVQQLPGQPPSGADWSDLRDESGWNQSSNFSGDLNTRLAFPLRIHVQELSDGVPSLGLSFDSLPADTSNGDESCAFRSDTAGGHLHVCSRTVSGEGETTLSYQRMGGDVTYRSSGFRRTWFMHPGNASVWTWNDVSGGQVARWPVGSSYGFDVSIGSGEEGYGVAPSFATQASDTASAVPYSCVTQPLPGGGQSQVCRESSHTTRTVSGSTSGQSP